MKASPSRHRVRNVRLSGLRFLAAGFDCGVFDRAIPDIDGLFVQELGTGTRRGCVDTLGCELWDKRKVHERGFSNQLKKTWRSMMNYFKGIAAGAVLFFAMGAA